LTDRRERRFQVFDVRSGTSEVVGEEVLTEDGHCSYSPDRQWVLNDTYPDRDRYQILMLYHLATKRRIDLVRGRSPEIYDAVCRCDLHPRWDRRGSYACLDSAHSGTRQVYIVDLREFLRTQDRP
jgi:hypothetical protein